MRCSKQILSAGLIALWALPTGLAWGVGLHVAVHHHDHPGHHHGQPQHEHHQLAEALAEIPMHGHHHDEAETPDHSHDVTLATPKLLDRPSSEILATLHPASCASPSPPALQVAEAPPRRGPPTALFTAHCSLLL